jgi:hypothetical protein
VVNDGRPAGRRAPGRGLRASLLLALVGQHLLGDGHDAVAEGGAHGRAAVQQLLDVGVGLRLGAACTSRRRRAPRARGGRRGPARPAS